MTLSKKIKYYKLVFWFEIFRLASSLEEYCNIKTQPYYDDEEICNYFDAHYIQ